MLYVDPVFHLKGMIACSWFQHDAAKLAPDQLQHGLPCSVSAEVHMDSALHHRAKVLTGWQEGNTKLRYDCCVHDGSVY